MARDTVEICDQWTGVLRVLKFHMPGTPSWLFRLCFVSQLSWRTRLVSDEVLLFVPAQHLSAELLWKSSLLHLLFILLPKWSSQNVNLVKSHPCSKPLIISFLKLIEISPSLSGICSSLFPSIIVGYMPALQNYLPFYRQGMLFPT